MNKFKLMMEQVFSGEYAPLEFSIDAETYLVEHYREMNDDDLERTYMLENDMPDICAEYESGMDEGAFIQRVRREYDRVFNSVN